MNQDLAENENAIRSLRLSIITTFVPIEARVEPVALPITDPLAHVHGVLNALTIQTDTVRDVTVIGPGAGPEQAGHTLSAAPILPNKIGGGVPSASSDDLFGKGEAF